MGLTKKPSDFEGEIQGELSDDIAQELVGLTYSLGPQMNSLTTNGVIPTPVEVAEYIRNNQGKDLPVGLRVALRDLTWALAYAIEHSALNRVLEKGVDSTSIAALRAVVPMLKEFEK